MKENEAFDMMKAKLRCMELYDLACIEKGCDRKCDDCDLNYAQGNLGEQKEAMEIAIKALEKQISKKPIRVSIGHNGDSTDGCPVCKKEFYEKVNFCSMCGKAIDWS